MFWYCFRERDKILDLFEMSSGQRMHTRYFQVGGVFEDIPRRLRARRCARSATTCPSRVDQYEALLDRNEIFLQRTRDVGDRRRASGCSSSASPARCCAPPASPWDLRKAAPYSSYDDFDFKIPVGTVGDDYDRYRVRLAGDARVGADHRAGARRPARGPVHRRRPQGRAAAAPRARDLDGGADPPLQARHRGLPRAAGRGLLPDRVARAASSAASCVADGSAKPARVHLRDPSFVNLQALPRHVRRRLHRRPDRRTWRCSTRSSEASTDEHGRSTRRGVPRFAHGSRVPGWDEARRPRRRTRPGVPDPRDVAGARASCARRSRRYMARYPDRRSAAIPALCAVQRATAGARRGRSPGGAR